MNFFTKIMRYALYFKAGIFPYSMAIALSVFYFIYSFFDLPSTKELYFLLQEHLSLEKLWLILFLSALFEGIFVINFYFPGTIITISLLLINYDLVSNNYFFYFFTIWLGFSMAMLLSYIIGYTGIYRLLLKLSRKEIIEDMKSKYEKIGSWLIPVISFHPNMLSILFVLFGSQRSDIRKIVYKALISLMVWMLIWSAFLRFLSSEIKTGGLDNHHYFVIAAFIIWGILESTLKWKKEKIEENRLR